MRSFVGLKRKRRQAHVRMPADAAGTEPQQAVQRQPYGNHWGKKIFLNHRGKHVWAKRKGRKALVINKCPN